MGKGNRESGFSGVNPEPVSNVNHVIFSKEWEKGRVVRTKKVSLAAVLIALGVVVSPLIWFPILDSKAFPGQHIINALAGVLLGPVWAAFMAFCIGVIRISMGVGTIFSMPGGIPGGVVVGLFYWFLKRNGFKQPDLAALTEPIGTVLVGGMLAVYLVAPYVGREMVLIPVWIGWSLSSIPGSALGLVVLKALRMVGLLDYFTK
jgi:energy coupling factor transporter S component ThiW